jgi:hypothetical protein
MGEPSEKEVNLNTIHRRPKHGSINPTQHHHNTKSKTRPFIISLQLQQQRCVPHWGIFYGGVNKRRSKFQNVTKGTEERMPKCTVT